MNWILKIKHWQLFLLFFLPLIVGDNLWHDGLSLGFSILGMLFYYYWLLSLGIQCEKINRANNIHSNQFVIFKILSIIIMVCYVILPSLVLFQNPDERDPDIFMPMFFTIIISHIYITLFSSKSAYRALNKKKSFFGDFLPVFGAIFFWPIGIWFLQPRLNKLLEENEEQ